LNKNIYIFSGLGTDERVFVNISLPEYHLKFIKWIEPLPSETIESYSARILRQIKDSRPILIGLSFGGMIAIEVAKQIETEKVIIISSAKTYKEIPLSYRIAGMIGIHKLIPFRMFNNFKPLTSWFFGTQSKNEKKMLEQVIKETDPQYLKWAIDKIVRWKNEQIPSNIYHIQGTKDRLLPLKKSQYNESIPGGGHLMILSKSKQIVKILRQQLAN
jgi:esterase/lipase